MSHDHAPHSHAVPAKITRAPVTGIILNLAFVIVEAGTGLFTHSLSLLTDAGHNLGDVASLALALLANKWAEKKANNYFSFGYRQSTVLVSLINAFILLCAVGAIVYEAVLRINHPAKVEGGTVAIIAGIGIVVNAFTALLFFKDRDSDLNMKGAFLHMASDALVSLGVLIAGLLIMFTNWFWLDTVVSVFIAAVIVAGTWGLLKESLRLTLNGVPSAVSLREVKDFLTKIPGVTEVHDLHIWAISTTQTALTVHLVIPGETQQDELYARIRSELLHRFRIGHSTVQIEKDRALFQCEQKCS